MRKVHLSSISLLALTIALPASAQQSLPTIEIGATPLRSVSRATARSTTPARPTSSGPTQLVQSQASTGTGGSRAPYISPLVTYQVPAAVHVVEGAEIANVRKFNLGEALQRTAPGVIINDVGGNPGFPEINYRGFNASPFAGVPQGLAVFQGGIRVNEMWGDTVNWDLIPSIAIDRVAIETGNPLYGLNAIGGAIVLDMKNGFTWQGAEVDVRGGSFMRRLGTFQFGKQVGDYAVYAAGEAMGDKGYRYFSGSNVKRFYGDIGYKAEQGEVHANVTLGSNYFGASGPAPVEMVAADKSSTYTTPQTYKNQVAMFDLNGQFQVAPNTKLLGDVHYRGYNQARVDGNTTELECEPGEPFCETDDGVELNVPNFFTAGGNDFTKGPALGAIDRTWTKVNTIGFTTQINNTDRILGFANKLTMGLNLEHGFTDFKASQELGIINQDLTVTGFNYFTSDPLAAITPVHINVANYYLGAYALDTIDLTEKLSATGGLRYNRAQISSFDNGPGGALNANNKFNHVNPMGGLTYKITPEIAAYSSYSVANRAPTPLELGCSDPNRPCVIDAFLVADPPLKQVTSNTIDTGLRGGFKPSDKFPSMLGFVPGAVQWSAGIFRTNVFDDIFAIPSKINGRGYFQNAGNTVRQGVELSARYNDERTAAYINYTITDAYMNSQNYLPSPGNPIQEAIGANSVQVNPGAQLPSIANHRFKTGVDYSVTKKWKIGGDFVYATGPYLGADWANQFGTLSPYGLLNLRTSYNFLPNVQMYALIENVTNTRSRNFGSLFETNEIPFKNYSSPKLVSVGPPTAFFAGMKWDYGNDPSTSSWIASANGMYEKDRDTEIKTKAPKKWDGLYAGLNAGYGWGATTGANTTSFASQDSWANTVNGALMSNEAAEEFPWGMSNTGGMAMANTGLANASRNGFIGGGQIGYNYQDESNVVLGAEADIQGTTFSGNGSYASGVVDGAHYCEEEDQIDPSICAETVSHTRAANGGGTVTAGTNWLGTFRGRLGYAVTPSLLAYGTGGLAYGNVHASSTQWTSAQTQDTENNGQLVITSMQPSIPGFSKSYSGFKAGWVAGGGLEWMFHDNWSLRAEGMYYNLGTIDLVSTPVVVNCGGVSCGGVATGATMWATTPITKIQFDGVIVRGGVNYHFDWGKADTVVAKF